jgi:hypothetical protein
MRTSSFGKFVAKSNAMKYWEIIAKDYAISYAKERMVTRHGEIQNSKLSRRGSGTRLHPITRRRSSED